METQKRRTGRLIGGIVIAAFAVIVAAGGGTLLWADATQRDGAGYFSTHTHRFHSGSRAIETEKVSLDGFPSWVGARARVEVSPGKPGGLFVGIASTRDADAYLRGVEHATANGLDWDPFRVRYAAHPGTRLPAPPAAQSFWVASARGSGVQSVTWKLHSGDWSVVVMNADGSRGVDVQAKAGVDWAPIFPLGLGLASGGALLLALGAFLVHSSGRRRVPAPVPRPAV